MPELAKYSLLIVCGMAHPTRWMGHTVVMPILYLNKTANAYLTK